MSTDIEKKSIGFESDNVINCAWVSQQSVHTLNIENAIGLSINDKSEIAKILYFLNVTEKPTKGKKVHTDYIYV